MLKKLQKNGKKGFTLVELIVVLVILAILAALLVPALTGYIDKAKEKQIIAETRQVVMAAQTLIDEKYATKTSGGTVTVSDTGDVKPADIIALAEVTGEVSDVVATPAQIGSTNTYKVAIVSLKYTAANGKICTYKATPEAGKDKYEVTNS